MHVPLQVEQQNLNLEKKMQENIQKMETIEATVVFELRDIKSDTKNLLSAVSHTK